MPQEMACPLFAVKKTAVSCGSEIGRAACPGPRNAQGGSDQSQIPVKHNMACRQGRVPVFPQSAHATHKLLSSGMHTPHKQTIAGPVCPGPLNGCACWCMQDSSHLQSCVSDKTAGSSWLFRATPLPTRRAPATAQVLLPGLKTSHRRGLCDSMRPTMHTVTLQSNPPQCTAWCSSPKRLRHQSHHKLQRTFSDARPSKTHMRTQALR